MSQTHRVEHGGRARLMARAALAALLCAALLPLTARAAADNPARALIERGSIDLRSHPDDGRRDAEAALLALQRVPDADLEIRARLLLCDYYYDIDQTAAEEQITRVKALLPNAQDKGLRAGALTCAGEVRETAGDDQQAKSLFEQAVTAASDARDEEMLAGALYSRGYLLGVLGDYAVGLADLRRAHSLYEKLSKPQHALTVLNALATLYDRMGDYTEAAHIYGDTLKAQRQAGLRSDEAVTLHNLARAHEHLNEWAQARQGFTSALEISRQIGYTRGEAYALRGLAAVAIATSDPSAALEMLDRAEALQRRTPDARLHAQIALARGRALHHLKRLPESAAALEEAMTVFRMADALAELSTACAELAAVDAEIGNWQGAYENEADHARLSDTLLRHQLDQRFATLKVEFDTAAKEKENTLLMRENEAGKQALAQGRAVRRLQAAVIALTVLLAAVLATLAIHQRGTTLRMRALAMTDELTGVPNRRAVLGRLNTLLKRADVARCSMLIMDIDHFKRINDHHGHPAGDEVLKVVAEKVREAVQEPAFFGRLGGEEFLIALPETPLEEACRIAERFRERIMSVDTARWFSDRRAITASIGVTISASSLDTPSTMLKRADTALYAAKRSGRNCVRVEAPPDSGTARGPATPEPGASAADPDLTVERA